MSKAKEPLDLVGRAAARMERDQSQTEPVTATPPIPPSPPSPPVPPMVDAEPTTAQPYEAASPEPTAGQSNAAISNVEVDFVALQKEGFLTPETQNSLLAEEFRLIKRPLLRIAFDSRGTENGIGHVIMVTSCHPEDGKTFVSSNLSLSMAMERDLFVLVIDADIRKRGLSTRLGVADRPGIMDVLLNPNLSISDVMVRTNIPNLAIIPAGRVVEGATELFASQRMTKLVHDIANRYKDRIIVFDGPPVLATSEPGVLAAHVGQILFVVKSGETTKRSISASLRLIDVCPNVHFAINRMMKAGGEEQFGYYG